MFPFLLGTMMLFPVEPTLTITPGDRVKMIDRTLADLPVNRKLKPLVKNNIHGIHDQVHINLGDTNLIIAVSTLAEYKDLMIDIGAGVNPEMSLYNIIFEGISWAEALSKLEKVAGVYLIVDQNLGSIKVGKMDIAK